MSKGLFYIGQPGTSAAAVVAASAATRTIDAATACNPTASAATITLHLVPSGDAAAADVALYSAFTVDAGATVVLSGLINQCIPAGATISAQASANAAITLTLSGRTA